MITYYLKLILTLAVITGAYGFAVPILVSAANTLMVIGGFALASLTPIGLYLLWSDEIGDFLKATSATSETETD